MYVMLNYSLNELFFEIGIGTEVVNVTKGNIVEVVKYPYDYGMVECTLFVKKLYGKDGSVIDINSHYFYNTYYKTYVTAEVLEGHGSQCTIFPSLSDFEAKNGLTLSIKDIDGFNVSVESTDGSISGVYSVLSGNDDGLLEVVNPHSEYMLIKESELKKHKIGIE